MRSNVAQRQRVDETEDGYRDIDAQDIQRSLDTLTDISLQSKRDGELLWGRIQGTKYRLASIRSQHRLLIDGDGATQVEGS